jgi:hypothetical protein
MLCARRAGEECKITRVGIEIVDARRRTIDDLVADARVRRTMTAQHEVDWRVPLEDLLERPTHDLGVVRAEDRRSLALRDEHAVRAGPEVVRGDGEARIEAHRLFVSDLDDVAEADVGEIVDDSAVGRALRHEHWCGAIEPPERYGLEVVPVDVREVHEVRVERLDEVLRNRWIVPPGSPIDAAHEPRIAYERGLSTPYQQSRV